LAESQLTQDPTQKAYRVKIAQQQERIYTVKNKKLLSLSLLIAIALMSFAVVGWLHNRKLQAQQLVAQPVSTDLPSCYSGQPEYQKILGRYVVLEGSIKYTLLEIAFKQKSAEEPVSDRILFRENLYGRCQLLNSANKQMSLLAWVPERVAVRLEVLAYQEIIGRVGRQKFQEGILAIPTTMDEKAWPYISFFLPEQVKALQQLGIRLPKGILVINQVCELERLNPINRGKLNDSKFIAEFNKVCPTFRPYQESQ
jgi:hypothetical protein